MTAYDRVLTAVCVHREARGQSFEAQVGVIWVIRNRAQDTEGRWPIEPARVVTQPRQFSCFLGSDPNVTVWPHPTICQSLIDLVDSIFLGEIPDPTFGANHYHSFQNQKDFPKWADPDKMTAHIGAFRFYKL